MGFRYSCYLTGDQGLKQRTLTEEFKREAVRILTASGCSTSLVVTDLGI